MFIFKRILNKFFSKINYKIKILKLEKKGIIIKNPSNISNFDKINFGTNIYIGPQALIMAKGGLIIGNNVKIGPRVSIWTENHNYNSDLLLPYDYFDIPKKVIIADNVWIGLGVLIKPGTVIDEGAIISMGSVVDGHVPKCSIYSGNPAVQVKLRDEKKYDELKNNNKFIK